MNPNRSSKLSPVNIGEPFLKVCYLALVYKRRLIWTTLTFRAVIRCDGAVTAHKVNPTFPLITRSLSSNYKIYFNNSRIFGRNYKVAANGRMRGCVGGGRGGGGGVHGCISRRLSGQSLWWRKTAADLHWHSRANSGLSSFCLSEHSMNGSL